MKKAFLVFLIFPLILIAKKPMAELHPQIKAALSKKKSLFILVRGEEWDYHGSQLAKSWSKKQFKSQVSHIQTLEIVIPDFQEKNYSYPFRLFKLPMLVVTDSQGRPVKIKEGVPGTATSTALLKFLTQSLTVEKQRDKYWKSKDAISIGKGLDLISDVFADGNAKSTYAAIFEKLRVTDPKDVSGYIMKYLNFEERVYKPFHEVKKSKNMKDYEKHIDMLNELLANNKVLTVKQQQLIHTAKFTVLRHCHSSRKIDFKTFRTRAIKELQNAVNLKADSMSGRASKFLIEKILKARSFK